MVEYLLSTVSDLYSCSPPENSAAVRAMVLPTWRVKIPKKVKIFLWSLAFRSLILGSHITRKYSRTPKHTITQRTHKESQIWKVYNTTRTSNNATPSLSRELDSPNSLKKIPQSTSHLSLNPFPLFITEILTILLINY